MQQDLTGRGRRIGRRLFLGGSVLAAAALAGCTASGRTTVHIAILDSGIADIDPFAGFDITREGEPATDPHGTQVASLLLGLTSTGTAGPATRLPADRVRFTSINVTSGGVPELTRLTDGVRRAVELNADVVNVSLGVRHPDPALEAAVAAAYQDHVQIVASAGNVRFLAPDFPARYEPALSVGAVDGDGNRYPLSPTQGIDVTAPGVDLPVLGLDGTPTIESGVSLATAVVTNRLVNDLLTGRIKRPTDFAAAIR